VGTFPKILMLSSNVLAGFAVGQVDPKHPIAPPPDPPPSISLSTFNFEPLRQVSGCAGGVGQADQGVPQGVEARGAAGAAGHGGAGRARRMAHGAVGRDVGLHQRDAHLRHVHRLLPHGRAGGAQQEPGRSQR